MSSYSQLSLEERCSIARLREAGQSVRQIAAALDRQPSTISRELSRNSGSKVGYRPGYAQAQAGARRWHGARLEREDVLREAILNRLGEGWSPEQIAGRLAHQAGHHVISHETIYRFVYAQLKRTNERRWRLYLPRSKYKRGRRNKGGGWPRIADRCSIHDRPHDIATRQVPGHWEADGMLFSAPGKAILVAHERRSRLTIAMPQQNLKADPVAAALTRMLRPMPPTMRRSITFDNGTEFARHYELHHFDIATFFCDPYAPWQKGGIENAIGRMRRVIPTKTDLACLPQHRLADLICAYNNTPRKCLDWNSPAEVFLTQLLHFKRESTCPLSRE